MSGAGCVPMTDRRVAPTGVDAALITEYAQRNSNHAGTARDNEQAEGYLSIASVREKGEPWWMQ